MAKASTSALDRARELRGGDLTTLRSKLGRVYKVNQDLAEHHFDRKDDQGKLIESVPYMGFECEGSTKERKIVLSLNQLLNATNFTDRSEVKWFNSDYSEKDLLIFNDERDLDRDLERATEKPVICCCKFVSNGYERYGFANKK